MTHDYSADKALEEWLSAQPEQKEEEAPSQAQPAGTWILPRNNILKCNVDGPWLDYGNRSRLDWILGIMLGKQDAYPAET